MSSRPIKKGSSASGLTRRGGLKGRSISGKFWPNFNKKFRQAARRLLSDCMGKQSNSKIRDFFGWLIWTAGFIRALPETAKPYSKLIYKYQNTKTLSYLFYMYIINPERDPPTLYRRRLPRERRMCCSLTRRS